jgi:secretion/DNA translocation related TadE-like protein
VIGSGRGVRSDRGAASVWSMGAVVALLSVTVAVLHLGGVAVARHQAESAADLAALAGAGRVVVGERAACERAARITERMRVRLDSCQARGWDVLVQVSARPAGPVGRFGAAVARARAGPVD